MFFKEILRVQALTFSSLSATWNVVYIMIIIVVVVVVIIIIIIIFLCPVLYDFFSPGVKKRD